MFISKGKGNLIHYNMRVVFVFNAEFLKSSIPHQELAYSPLGGIPPRLGTPALNKGAQSSYIYSEKFVCQL